MNKYLRNTLAVAVVAFVAGCATPGPRGSVAEADPMIPTEWPLPASTGVAGEGATTALPDIGWRDFFADPRLQEVVGLALDNNRDLRVAILNVDRARAQHRIQRADRFPSVGINAQMERVGADNPALESETYSVGLGVTAFDWICSGACATSARPRCSNIWRPGIAARRATGAGGRSRQSVAEPGRRPRAIAYRTGDAGHLRGIA